MNFLEIQILGNTLLSIGITVIILFSLVFFVIILQMIVVRRLRKWAKEKNMSNTEFIIGQVHKNIFPLVYFWCFWISLQNLTLPSPVNTFLATSGKVIFSFFLVKALISTVKHIIKTYWKKKEENGDTNNTIKVVFPAVTIFIWIVGALFLMDNIGFDISGLIAGLGVGGIAVAIASQSVLGDIFNYFTIIIDRPFEIGDFIIFDNLLGVVEHVGLKSTRIRSLWGEQIILSNSDLMKSRIKNYKRMQERRVEFKFGVEYGTPLEKLKKIPVMIREIIENTQNTRFDRAHFSSYADYFLEFVVVYYIYSADYNLYMDIQQDINFKINERFRENEISFAFPTMQVYMDRQNKTGQ
ncbi:MAG: mechanosensitive ion channel family protein [Spirochaetales bacterium]|nr:mechanosensitive ion channel family protein [Spirochaetales bacterium]